MADCNEYSNELPGSLRCGEFLDWETVSCWRTTVPCAVSCLGVQRRNPWETECDCLFSYVYEMYRKIN